MCGTKTISLKLVTLNYPWLCLAQSSLFGSPARSVFGVSGAFNVTGCQRSSHYDIPLKHLTLRYSPKPYSNESSAALILVVLFRVLEYHT